MLTKEDKANLAKLSGRRLLDAWRMVNPELMTRIFDVVYFIHDNLTKLKVAKILEIYEELTGQGDDKEPAQKAG